MSLRVALYSHNGFGLGHIRRNVKLAEGILRRRPNADILLITGSAAFHAFPLPANLDYVKLPAVRKQATGRWRPQALDIEMEQLLRLRQTIILEAVRTYRPHLFVADFLPLGVERELVPALDEIDGRSDARAAIGFRDILDEPEAIRQAWELDDSREALEQLYDLVLVYGQSDWFDFARYGLPAELPRYVGLLGEPDAAPRPAPAGKRRILATSGGGADGYPVLAAALEALELLHGRHDEELSCTSLTGPLMPQPDLDRLRGIGKRVGSRVRVFADDLAKTFARASAVVGMGGYNTVCDVLSFRRPAAIVPRPGPSQEQKLRAKLLGDRGLATIIELAECTPRSLAEALLPLLDGDSYPESALPDLGGVSKAADALLELVE